MAYTSYPHFICAGKLAVFGTSTIDKNCIFQTLSQKKSQPVLFSTLLAVYYFSSYWSILFGNNVYMTQCCTYLQTVSIS